MDRTVVIALVMAVGGLVLLFNGALGLTISGWGDAEAIFGLFLLVVSAILLFRSRKAL